MRLNLSRSKSGETVVESAPQIAKKINEGIQTETTIENEAARRILEQSGVLTRSNKEAPEISKILDMKGLSRDEIAGRLKDLAFFSEMESVRLQATKLALELHGDLRRDNENRIPNLTFVLQNFSDSGSSHNLDTILTPRDITNV